MINNNYDLRDMRRQLHLTLRKAASKIGGIAASTLWNAENGSHEIGSKKLERILDFYKSELAKREMSDHA